MQRLTEPSRTQNLEKLKFNIFLPAVVEFPGTARCNHNWFLLFLHSEITERIAAILNNYNVEHTKH